MMDRLDEKAIESMKDLAAGATRRLLPEPASVVFFDCTTLHFESVDADGLREFGFSKNGRHGRTQVLLALMAASDGLPIGCEVFPGSEHEGKSLIPSLEKMREREGVETAIHVADRGMFGEANLKDMEERDLQHIVGAPAEIAAEGLEGADSRPRHLQSRRRLRGPAFGGVQAQGPPHRRRMEPEAGREGRRRSEEGGRQAGQETRPKRQSRAGALRTRFRPVRQARGKSPAGSGRGQRSRRPPAGTG